MGDLSEASEGPRGGPTKLGSSKQSVPTTPRAFAERNQLDAPVAVL